MENTTHKSTQLKMNRQQFFTLLGKRLAGFYFVALGALSIKSLLPARRGKAQPTLKSKMKVSAHPMAVKRSKRG